ncbi:hypothetical protein [Streptomyces sp. HUAS TT7]|uniref:hypothetical protein n=1 Tax=Streptomyces sp. HUAS TT7 TaxID=3447507 RepID=UPI003F659297
MVAEWPMAGDFRLEVGHRCTMPSAGPTPSPEAPPVTRPTGRSPGRLNQRAAERVSPSCTRDSIRTTRHR